MSQPLISSILQEEKIPLYTKKVILTCPECGEPLEALPLHDDPDGMQNLLWMCKAAVTETGSCLFPNTIDSTVFWVKRSPSEKAAGYVPFPEVINIPRRYRYLYPSLFRKPEIDPNALHKNKAQQKSGSTKTPSTWTSSLSSVSPSGTVPVTRAKAKEAEVGTQDAGNENPPDQGASNQSECDIRSDRSVRSSSSMATTASKLSTLTKSSSKSGSTIRRRRQYPDVRVKNCLSILRSNSEATSEVLKRDSIYGLVETAIKKFEELPKLQFRLIDNRIRHPTRALLKKDTIMEEMAKLSASEKVTFASSLRQAKSTSEFLSALGRKADVKSRELVCFSDEDEKAMKKRIDEAVEKAIRARKQRAVAEKRAQEQQASASTRSAAEPEPESVENVEAANAMREQIRAEVAQLIQNAMARSRCSSRMSIPRETSAPTPQLSVAVPSPLAAVQEMQELDVPSPSAALMEQVEAALQEEPQMFDDSLMDLDLTSDAMEALNVEFDLSGMARLDHGLSDSFSNIPSTSTSDPLHSQPVNFNLEDLVLDPSNPSFSGLDHHDLFDY